MPDFDESSLRKAASWQDFKEAQGLLAAGAVTSSEKTDDGWHGSVKQGKRMLRTSVIARTPTWFDAKCPCPANQREGKFCPHAIATGLHLLSPPPAQGKSAPANAMPDIAWSICVQGQWQQTLGKARLSASVSRSDRAPTEADSRLTAWLVAHNAVSRPPVQLSLSATNLSDFLACIDGHPDITAHNSDITVDSGAQITLEDCTQSGDMVLLIPSRQEIAKIGQSLWKISASGLSRIGNAQPAAQIAPVLKELSEGEQVRMAMGQFLRDLDLLQADLDFSSSEWFQSLHFIPEKPDFQLSVTGSVSKIQAVLHVSYPRNDLPRLEGSKVFTHNPKEENRARSTHPLVNGTFTASDPDTIRSFLTGSIKAFPDYWKRDLAPAVLKLCSSYVFVTPRIEIVSSGDDWLDFELNFETDSGSPVSAAEIRRLIRSNGSEAQVMDGKRIILSDDIENLIEPLFEDLDINQENGRFTAKKASVIIIQELHKKNHIRNNISGLNDFAKSNFPAAIHDILRPYQAQGAGWLIDRLNRFGGALLADDMGLGKTLQTIACVENMFTTCSHPSPVLVVVTTSLLGNWLAEFKRFAPDRRVITLHGADRDKLREEILPDDVVLTTYGTLARDLAWHLRQEYSIAVIDEASLIRNPDTDHSKAVAKLNAARRIALSGTPVENSARDLWSIFRFIQPGWLGSRSHFKERYETPLSAPETAQRTATLLRLKTSPFVLRRTKSEVAPELPSKIQINEFIELSKDQAATYRELLAAGRRRIEEIRDSGQEAAARMQTLTTLLRLRQTCCDLALLDSEKLRALPVARRSAKLERLLQIAEQSIASGSKILVFSQFQKQLVEIESALGEAGIFSLRLDGKTRNRQKLVDRFQAASGPPVFLISLKAGGYGLNLTAADVVIHFDPWWNPAAEAQATDRAHRIGQTKPVTVFRFLTRGTVEEKVVHLQSTKKALADSLDESSTNAGDAPAWTSDELESLLMS
jgi:hypothetical protein